MHCNPESLADDRDCYSNVWSHIISFIDNVNLISDLEINTRIQDQQISEHQKEIQCCQKEIARETKALSNINEQIEMEKKNTTVCQKILKL